MFASLIKNPTTRAYILAAVRHGVTYGGGLLSAYLISKGASASDAASVVQGLIGVALALTSVAFSMMDVSNVDKKVNAAIALAPQTPPQVIDALKQGTF